MPPVAKSPTRRTPSKSSATTAVPSKAPATKTAPVKSVVAKNAAPRKAPSRRPGRPVGTSNGMLDRQTVLAVAFSLTKTVSLNELSIVRVAKELGVTPALIHYYFAGGGRDALTSGVMNSFYREVVENWAPEIGDWNHNLEVVAEYIYRAYLRYPGVTMYAASHNRYQLVQDVQEGETDYGLVMLEKFTGTVRQAGFDGARTGVLAHLIMMFITAFASATVARRWPGQHSEFLNSKLSALDPAAFPNCHFVRNSLTNLHGPEAFAAGLRIILEGLGAERDRVLPKKK